MSSLPPLVAVLDDEVNMRIALRRLLSLRGYEVALFETGSDLLNACLSGPPIRCIILDLHMPGMNGFDVLSSLARSRHRPPVIVITGHDQAGNVERVTDLGARAYLTKPVDGGPLLGLLAELTSDAGKPHQ